MFVPSKAAHHEEASAESSMSQMTSIRQMLQQSTLLDLEQSSDPKRRLMHALATAALQKVGKWLSEPSALACCLLIA